MKRLIYRSAVGTLLLLGSAGAAAAQGNAYDQLRAFSGVLSYVRQNYVDSVDFSRLVHASIQGMLRSLDPHSHYMTRHEFQLQQQWDRGELGDAGMTLVMAAGKLTVLSLAPKGAAIRAGIQPGDRLIGLNDSTLSGLEAQSVAYRMLGEVGSKIRLTLERGSPVLTDTFGVTLRRTSLQQRVVSQPQLLDPRTGYVRLEEFTSHAPKELFHAIRKATDLGARQLVLDLRANSGGDIHAMSQIASGFLPKNREVFHTEGRRLQFPPVVTTEDGDFSKLPLILLIDAQSASAAEMLAGSLQDHDRALVVGRRSFGKALIQSSMPLPNGDIVWLTTARVVTPSGRVIQRRYSTGELEPYFERAGTEGAADDAAKTYRTARGREVKGGGGVLPDIVRPAPVELPVWFTVAIDSGYGAVVDSAAELLGRDGRAQSAWMADSTAWDTLLVSPFLSRVQRRLTQVSPDPRLRGRIRSILASRAAGQRWGAEAETEFQVRNDDDIRAALEAFSRLPELLRETISR